MTKESISQAVALQSIATIFSGDSVTSKELIAHGKYAVYGGNGIRGYFDNFNQSEDRVIVGRVGALCGNVHIAKAPFWASEHALVVKPHTHIDLRWLAACLVHASLGKLSMSSAQPVITATNVGMTKIPLPPQATQRTIADYLDRETAEIDGMRADLDEMERLLETRREAMIGTLITSTPCAYYPIAVTADITLGKMVQPTQKSRNERLAPYLRAAHVPQPGTLDTSVEYKEMWFAPREMELLTLRKGDVVVVEGGAGYGRSALINEDMAGWGFQNSIVRIRAFESVSHGPFIAYALRHAQALGQIEIAASSATLPHFTAEKVSRFRIPLPPLAEQRRIADEIDRETAEIDSMLSDITKLRDLLAERRTALISAAVTGQMDIPVSPTHKDEAHA